jgi:hypothetical protein
MISASSVTLSPDGKWMWDGSNWIPAPPPQDPEELIFHNAVPLTYPPKPTSALPAPQPPTSITKNPLAMNDNTTIVGKNIFQKSIIYIVTFMFLLFLYLGVMQAHLADSYWQQATGYENDYSQNCYNEFLRSTPICQGWADDADRLHGLADETMNYSYAAFALSLMSLGYIGYFWTSRIIRKE